MGTHFTPKGITFLRGIARHNDREWFEARRDVYEAELRAPLLALIDEINRAMEGFASEHVRPANKIMMRIYRDTRFSHDKRPYKTHLSAWWARRGMQKTSGAGFYLQVSPKEIHVSAGVYMPEREQLLALRRWMADHHAAYRTTVNGLLKPRGRVPAMQPIESDALKRMPKGFPADHPAGDLLRASSWGVSAHLPAAEALEGSFAEQVVRRFRRCAPLVAMLNEGIVPTTRDVSDRPRLSFL